MYLNKNFIDWEPPVKINTASGNGTSLNNNNMGSIYGMDGSTLHSSPTSVHMFGHLVPSNHDKATEIGRKNGNTKWDDSKSL